MPAKTTNVAAEQLELFRPPPTRPLWDDLPEDVRREACERITQMLRKHMEGNAVIETDKEDSDE